MSRMSETTKQMRRVGLGFCFGGTPRTSTAIADRLKTGVVLACVIAVFGGIVGCNNAQHDHMAPSKVEVPIAETGYCYCLYAMKGWDQGRVRKAFGTPKKIIVNENEFVDSVNYPPMKHRLNNEVEQWSYVGPGLQHTLVTFDTQGKVVRATNEWSDF